MAPTTDWPIPLNDRPRLLNMALATHGMLSCEQWQDLSFWCVHLYRYHAELGINGQWFKITPGTLSIVPPRTVLEYRFSGRSQHVFAHFTLARGRQLSGPRVTAVRDVGAEFTRLNRELEQAIGWTSTNPLRAEVRLWDILWELATSSSSGASTSNTAAHPALERAMQAIELHLDEPLSIPQIARQAEVSHNHLTRLFRATHGITVIGYIQYRRVQRARHLLERSDLPIKAIAQQVGIADLHLFNKTIRRALGASPRRIRAAAR